MIRNDMFFFMLALKTQLKFVARYFFASGFLLMVMIRLAMANFLKMTMKTVKAVSILSLLTRYLQQYNIAHKIFHFLIRPKYTKISLLYHQSYSRCSDQLQTFVLEYQFNHNLIPLRYHCYGGRFTQTHSSIEQMNCETVSGEDGSFITTNQTS